APAVGTDALPGLVQRRARGLEAVDARDMPAGSVPRVVRRWSAPVLPRRRMVALIAGAAAVGGTGVAVWMATHRPPRGPEPRNLAIGVGPFRSSGSDQATAWIGPALRDGLNSQLTELPGVRVFSDEFMDFVMTREGLSAIAVAQRL